MEYTKEDIRKALLEELRPVCEFALVFGSMNADSFNKDSDVDVAVYFKKEISSADAFDIRLKLASMLDRSVDLIYLNNSDIIITMQTLSNGVILINNNNKLFVKYKSEKISQYIDFKKSRKIIEDNILRRKKYV